MNAAQCIITKRFAGSLEHAEACLRDSNVDLADDVSDIDIHGTMTDMRWAHATILTEKVLLVAFAETVETAAMTIEGLIDVARRKLFEGDTLKGKFVDGIVGYYQDIGMIQDVEPHLLSVYQMIRSEFRRVVQELCPEESPKKKRSLEGRPRLDCTKPREKNHTTKKNVYNRTRMRCEPGSELKSF